MGITKLPDVIASNPHLLTYVQLRDTNLVIDGNSFCHQIYNASGIDGDYPQYESLFAGNYPLYETKINRYLERFTSANITLSFVFDGSLDVETLTNAKSVQQLNNRLKVAKLIVSRSDRESLLLPLLAQQVLVDILIARGIEIYQCAGKANAMAVGLANVRGAPLLSSDSDFFVFDLNRGYIPFDTIDLSDETSSYIKAKLYKLEKFLECCPGVDRRLLPLFAFLCGNDFSTGHDLRTVIENISRPGVSSIRLAVGAFDKRQDVIAILEWLRNKDDEDDAIIEALSPPIMKWQLRDEIHRAIKLSMAAYRRCDPTGGSFDLTSIIKREIAYLDLPDWFVNEYVGGKMPAIFLRIRRDQKVHLNAVIGDHEKPSVYEYCRPIRLAVYRILWNRESMNCFVSEYDRGNDSDSERGSTRYVEHQLPLDGDNIHRDKERKRLPQLNDVQEMRIDERRQTFLAVFEFSEVESSIIDNFPDGLSLFACSFVFWYRSDGVGATRRQARALLLCAVCLYNNDDDSKRRLFDIDNSNEGYEYKKSGGRKTPSRICTPSVSGKRASRPAGGWMPYSLVHSDRPLRLNACSTVESLTF